MSEPFKVVNYVNQFFAGVGGEDKANHPVEFKEGAIGSARGLQQQLGSAATVVATVYGGDNFVNEEKDRAFAAIADALRKFAPDVVIAGPAFNAGRYGLACAEVCRIAREKRIPAVAAMYPENPGVLTHRADTLIVPTSESPAGMPAAHKALAALALKLARKEELGPAEAEGYLPRGIRRMGYREAPAARRAEQDHEEDAREEFVRKHRSHLQQRGKSLFARRGGTGLSLIIEAEGRLGAGKSSSPEAGI